MPALISNNFIVLHPDVHLTLSLNEKTYAWAYCILYSSNKKIHTPVVVC